MAAGSRNSRMFSMTTRIIASVLIAKFVALCGHLGTNFAI
jgi:hypothetical protein